MKKKELQNLNLNKKTIVDFSKIPKKGGGELSERRTNCDQCPGPVLDPPGPCYTAGGVPTCDLICIMTNPVFSVDCSK